MPRTDAQAKLMPECSWCAENVGATALWGNFGLMVLKLICGILGQSRAVFADAIHSAADVVTAIILVICLRVASSPADREHPFGHGAIEYTTALFVSLSLSTVATLIFLSALSEIASGVTYQPSMLALLAEVVSIFGNELMFRHSLCCGQRFGSPAMIANAYENRADVISTVAALIGVIGAQLGYLFMDPLGAILVTVVLFHSAYKMMRSAWRGILDRSLDESMEQKIRRLAAGTPGVEGVGAVKTRALGQSISIDLEILVPPQLSLVEGCAIAERVKATLSKNLSHTGLITVTPVGGMTND